jgi:basic membrane protein A and related proteins
MASVFGCGKNGPSSGAPAGGSAKTFRVGMVTDTGGTDDESFNASGAAGLKRAAEELGCDQKFLESREQADYRTNLSSLAEAGYGYVIALGYMMEEAVELSAKDFPDTKFAIVDGKGPQLPNAASLQFREEEGSFLAGFLAASMSRKRAVGFLGGMDVPVLRRFEAGYTAGARTADPSVRVVAKYVASFSDPGKGNIIAEQMLNEVDVLFAAAGKSGLGALKACAAKGPGTYGIGSDSDQDDIHPGRVLTSMMKRVDNAVFNSIKAMKEGTWKPGEQTFGLKEGGVHLSPMTHTKKDVPGEVLAELDALSKMIVEGRLKPPRTMEELRTFKPPLVPEQ